MRNTYIGRVTRKVITVDNFARAGRVSLRSCVCLFARKRNAYKLMDGVDFTSVITLSVRRTLEAIAH